MKRLALNFKQKTTFLNPIKSDKSITQFVINYNTHTLFKLSSFKYRNFNSKNQGTNLDNLNENNSNNAPLETTVVDDYSTNKEIAIDKKLFVNGRFNLVKDKKIHSPNFISIYQICITGLGVFFGYRAVLKFFKFQVIRGVLYSLAAVYLANNYNVLKFHKQMFIYSLNLLEDGKRVEIMLYNQNINIVDISAVRPLNDAEKTFYATLMNSKLSASYYPIVINEKLYCFYANNIHIYDREIFNAIKNSKYITVKDDVNSGKDNIIDLE